MNTPINHLTAGFIGLGLIGGSIARGLKRSAPDIQIMAYMRTREKLEQAHADGIVDLILDGVDEHLSECDIIFLCTPVEFNESYLRQIRPFLKEGAVVTDVGSTKTSIHETVAALGMESCFVGGHPMAGSEKTGYESSTDHLLENAYYIITPTPHTPASYTDRMVDVANAIGALPLVLDYHRHDFIVAAISHLPHLIASSLVNLVHDCDSEDQMMKRLAAGGFKDITRIASSSPEMWQQICTENQAQVLQMLDAYREDLALVEAAIRKEDNAALIKYFDQARIYRNALPESYRGTIQPLPEIYVDVPDETGAISVVSAILAANRLSIKNMGIRNNREVQAGALKIVFENMKAAAKAAEILKKYNYTVYERD